MIFHGYVDYSGHVVPTSTDALAELAALASQMQATETELARLESELAVCKKELTNLSEVVIPEKMDALGLQDFTTREGYRVSVKDSVHAHISKANQAAAMKWLSEHGHGGMIKRAITVRFDQDQEEEASSLLGELRGEFPDTSQEMQVHPSTLRSWAREMLNSGEELPMALFGIHVKRIAQQGK